MFQPITDFVLGKYFADEAAYAEQFTRMGFPPFPAPKDLSKPTKTWSAPASATHKWGGIDRPGFLTILEGQSVAVVDQAGKGEQFTWSTAIVPAVLGQLLTNFQAAFYVEYRYHADYEQGIPLLGQPTWDTGSASADWLFNMNFVAVSPSGRALPPIDQGRLMNWGMRFKPGATGKRLEDVEVFPIEKYRAQFKPPVAQPKPAGEYVNDDVTLAKLAMDTLFKDWPLADKGSAIRKAAEARKG